MTLACSFGVCVLVRVASTRWKVNSIYVFVNVYTRKAHDVLQGGV